MLLIDLDSEEIFTELAIFLDTVDARRLSSIEQLQSDGCERNGLIAQYSDTRDAPGYQPREVMVLLVRPSDALGAPFGELRAALSRMTRAVRKRQQDVYEQNSVTIEDRPFYPLEFLEECQLTLSKEDIRELIEIATGYFKDATSSDIETG